VISYIEKRKPGVKKEEASFKKSSDILKLKMDPAGTGYFNPTSMIVIDFLHILWKKGVDFSNKKLQIGNLFLPICSTP
jgi:hypothetical protein